MTETVSTQKIVSADTHVLEPPEFWQEWVPEEFRDQVPRLVRGETHDEWWIGDFMYRTVGGVDNQAGVRLESAETKEYGEGDTVAKAYGTLSADDWNEVTKAVTRWEDTPRGGWDPHAMLADLDIDGIYAGVLFPTTVLTYYRQPTSPVIKAVLNAYNEWIGNFCKADPKRLKGLGTILLDDIEDSITQMKRCKELGLAGVLIPAYPEPHLPYSDPIYEPFWAAAEELEMPLAMHIQAWRCQPEAGQLGPMAHLQPEVAEFIGDREGQLFGREPVDFFCTTDFYIRRSTGELIFSGVFERYPKLHLLLAEFDAGFVPYHLSRMDHTYFEYPQVVSGDTGGHSIPFPSGMIPSEFWYRNVSVTFQEDPLSLQRLRDIIGVKSMMWGNDYPHRESTWPKSLQMISETFVGVPENERDLILSGNARRIFKID